MQNSNRSTSYWRSIIAVKSALKNMRTQTWWNLWPNLWSRRPGPVSGSCVGPLHSDWTMQLEAGLCSTHESWVNFDSTLIQMSRVRVESVVKIKDVSRVRVELRWSSFESELSQLDTAWVKVESLIFRRENVKILQLSVTLQRKNQPTLHSTAPPPPPSTTFSQVR